MRTPSRYLLLTMALLGPAAASAADGPFLAWSRNGSGSPRFSAWNGSSWPAATTLSSVGSEPVWMVLRVCPVRDELILATLDEDKHVDVMIRSGTSWSPVTAAGTATGQDDERAFDVAYSAISGTAMLAYWNDSSKRLCSRTTSGSGWSAESTLTLPATSKLRYLRLHPVPSSDQLIMLCVNDDKNLFAAVWNGSAFSAVTTIESAVQTKDEECFALAFESTSGQGLLVYAENGQNTPRYRTFISGSWSSESSAPTVGAKPLWVRLAAEPGTDRIVLATLDDDEDLNVCIWSGSAWGTVTELETHMGTRDHRCYDVAFRSSGGGLISYVRNNQKYPRYRTLAAGSSSWSGVNNGPNLGDTPEVIQMTPDQSGNVYLTIADSDADLHVLVFNGTSLAIQATVETSLGGDEETEPFMLAVAAGSGTTKPRLVQWRHTAPD